MLRTVAVLIFTAGAALGQNTPPAQMLTATGLHAKSVELQAKARSSSTGAASAMLLQRPDSNIQQAVRVASGQGEWHRDDADILIGVEGSARIITGGDLVNGKDTAPGERRGDSVSGGTAQPFGAGDYIRIEPGVAHQILLSPGTTLRYMAVKVRVAPR